MTLLDRFGEGLHPNLAGEDYYARCLGEANSGSLKLILTKSLAHYRYWATEELDDEARAKEKAHFTFGRAYHAALLEPERFAAEYVVEPVFGSLQSSKVRTELAHWRDRHSDKGIISAAQLRTLSAMGDRLRAHPLISKLLSVGGRNELTAVWRDRETGLPCKARIDHLNMVLPGRFFVLDPKTCENASAEGFARAAASWFYQLQFAHYVEGLRALGVPLEAFYFIAQEKEPPYECAIYQFEPQDEELGFRQRAIAMRRLARAVETDQWPGLNNDQAARLRLPAYAHYNLNNEGEG
jgi:hypothetical protein